MAVVNAPSSLPLTTIIHHSQAPKSCIVSCTLKKSSSQVLISCSNGSVKARFGSSKGGASVLERPSFDQSQFDPATQVQEGFVFVFQFGLFKLFKIDFNCVCVSDCVMGS